MNGLIYCKDAVRNYYFICRINFKDEITLDMVNECFEHGTFGNINTTN